MPSNLNKNKFLYFAYGSNLLRERLALANPSAQFINIGKLGGYGLVFQGESKLWHGAVASIDQQPDSEVWGVVWALDVQDMPTLDRQEGRYAPLTVEVVDPEGGRYECRTYQMNGPGLSRQAPSPQYKAVIALGARQAHLPGHYLSFIDRIQDNGFRGHLDIYDSVMSLLEEYGSDDGGNESDSEK